MEAAARLHGLRDALNLLENAQPEQAAQICRRLISQNRADTEALLLLGLAVGMQGHAAAAAPLLNRVAHTRRGMLIRAAILPECLSRKTRRPSLSRNIARA